MCELFTFTPLSVFSTEEGCIAWVSSPVGTPLLGRAKPLTPDWLPWEGSGANMHELSMDEDSLPLWTAHVGLQM